MTWGVLFRLRQYLKGSLWVLPLLGGLIGTLAGSAWLFVDRSVEVPAYWQYSASTAGTLLAAIVGASAALTGFVVTVAVLVVQMATGTFSARYLRLWYRDRLLRATLAVLIGTLTFAFQLLRRVESDFVPNTGVTIAGALMGAGLLLFILFLDRSIKRMRPVAVAALVAGAGRKAFQQAVRAASEPDAPDVLPGGWAPPSEATFVVRSDRAGAVQAIDARGLVRWAQRHECLLVLQHVVGDFVSTGAPLIEVHGGAADPRVAERRLRGMVALGVERTIEQDPAFAVRVMVDIANKALSAAINDPTTAVQVIDHLGETLHLIGTTDLEGLSAQRGPGHVQRVIVPTRRWEEFLALGVTEIRYYGGSAIQVVRRLHAMLEELQEAVLPEHRAAVADELARLQKTVEMRFADSADLDRARVAGRQGIGGPTAA